MLICIIFFWLFLVEVAVLMCSFFNVQHSSAAQIYVDIGAVDFLSQLRPNVDSSLHRVIDSILDNLFHLPAASVDDHVQHECIYHHQQIAACELFT